MKIRTHVIFTAILCVLIYSQAGLLNTLVVFAFGVLIDADHYLYYIFKFKKFNPFKAHTYFENIKDATHLLLIFHCVEWCLVLLVLALYFEVAFYALLGFTGHIALDYVQTKFMTRDGRNLSLMGWWVKRK